MAKDQIEAEVRTKLGQTMRAMTQVNDGLKKTARTTDDVNRKNRDVQRSGESAWKGIGAAIGSGALAAAGKYLKLLVDIEKKEAERFGKARNQGQQLFNQVQGLVGGQLAGQTTEAILGQRGAISTAQQTSFLSLLGSSAGVEAASPAELFGLLQAFERTSVITGDSGENLASAFNLFRGDVTPGESDKLGALAIAIQRRGGLDSATNKKVSKLIGAGLPRFDAIGLALAAKRAQVEDLGSLAADISRGLALEDIASGQGSEGSQLAVRQIQGAPGVGLGFATDTSAELRSAFQQGKSFVDRENRGAFVGRLRSSFAAERDLEIFEQSRLTDDRALQAFEREQSIRLGRSQLEREAAAGSGSAQFELVRRNTLDAIPGGEFISRDLDDDGQSSFVDAAGPVALSAASPPVALYQGINKLIGLFSSGRAEVKVKNTNVDAGQ